MKKIILYLITCFIVNIVFSQAPVNDDCSAAIDLAYVACGRFDAFYEYSLNPWDVAAGAIIVKEAGGSVKDFEGGENYMFGREILASNLHVESELLNRIKQSF